jgi:hypothetical protein
VGGCNQRTRRACSSTSSSRGHACREPSVPRLTAGDCDVAVAGLLEGHLPSSQSQGVPDKVRCNRRLVHEPKASTLTEKCADGLRGSRPLTIWDLQHKDVTCRGNWTWWCKSWRMSRQGLLTENLNPQNQGCGPPAVWHWHIWVSKLSCQRTTNKLRKCISSKKQFKEEFGSMCKMQPSPPRQNLMKKFEAQAGKWISDWRL